MTALAIAFLPLEVVLELTLLVVCNSSSVGYIVSFEVTTIVGGTVG